MFEQKLYKAQSNFHWSDLSASQAVAKVDDVRATIKVTIRMLDKSKIQDALQTHGNTIKKVLKDTCEAARTGTDAVEGLSQGGLTATGNVWKMGMAEVVASLDQSCIIASYRIYGRDAKVTKQLLDHLLTKQRKTLADTHPFEFQTRYTLDMNLLLTKGSDGKYTAAKVNRIPKTAIKGGRNKGQGKGRRRRNNKKKKSGKRGKK